MKMWDGRFIKHSDSLMEKFHNSLPFDKTLIDEDIKGSKAWAGALEKLGVYKKYEYNKICKALDKIRDDYHNGKIFFDEHDEDIHMAIERILIERAGKVGARLHTGRSRNDQVTTDLRLFVKTKIIALINCIIELQKVLIKRTEKDKDIIMPGYTHLQQAQPILVSHYWLSFFFILEREKERLNSAYKTADILPLGSGAIAGSGFTIDREYLAEKLGFSKISENSIDGVASRDYVLEVLSACSSLGITLSRYAEDLIIFSSAEFGFIELDDAWSTGSSMMPQKKNPDSLELIRGKCGRFIGNYVRFASTLKGVGLAYYKDLQEDKESLFDSLLQMEIVLKVFKEVIETLSINKDKIKDSLNPFLLATDLADYLVKKGMPFREAHRVIGKIVAHCIEKKEKFTALKIEDLKKFSKLFDEDVESIFSWEKALSHRELKGGTGKKSVDRQIRIAKKILRIA